MGISATAPNPVPGAATLGPFGQLLRHREASFRALRALGWSADFIAQYVSAMVNPERMDPGDPPACASVPVVAALSGFGL